MTSTSMTQATAQVKEPIPISQIGGRYLLFDVDAVTYLRRKHHILGVLVGGIPQAPQQNVFLGLPLELIPEEVKLLVEKEAAYIVDDTPWHQDNFALQTEERQRYLESLRSQGRTAKRVLELTAKKKQEKALLKQAAAKGKKQASTDPAVGVRDDEVDPKKEETQEESLFGDERPASRTSHSSTLTTRNYHPITPAVSYTSTSTPRTSDKEPDVPASYPLFKHLHDKDYFMMPGLRFGCNYNVYPGDPLRFHSHFLAVGYDWEEEIPLLDLIGGGRLGTAVKKGFLIGGQGISQNESHHEDVVRTFCIEWGGM